ncbi:MAG: ABC transporter permease [Candidatus Micrarchaeia archaeon]
MTQLSDYWRITKKIALSDLKLRYKNSLLGVFWSLLEPLLIFAVLYLVFYYVMDLQVGHYYLFLFLGIVCWDLFEKATMMGMTSITDKPSLVKKIYIPRETLVLGRCITALFMIIFELVIFFILLLISGIPITPTFLLFPFILIGEFLIALGIGFALASLNVYYRDVQYIWAVLLRALFFLSPVIYPTTIYPAEYFEFFMLNPLARAIEASRKTILYNTLPTLPDFGIVYLAAILSLAIGYFVFIKLEPRFAEEV